MMNRQVVISISQAWLRVVEMKHLEVIFQVLELEIQLEFLEYHETATDLRYRHFDEFDLIVVVSVCGGEPFGSFDPQ